MDKLVSSHLSSEQSQRVLRKTLTIISGKWRLRIIFQLAGQKRRFTALSRSMPELSDKVLMSELNELVALGFLQKESFREIPPRVEYRLTEKAYKVMPILHQLTLAVEMVFSNMD